MTKHDIVFIASEPWEHHIWRRRHHVARQLAKKNRVLWISPPVLSLGLIFRKHYHLAHYKRKVIFDLGRLNHMENNLWVYCPVQPLPTWHKIPEIARFNERFVLRDVQRIARKLDIQSPILWLHRNQSTLSDYKYFGLFKEKLSILDIFDPIAADGFDWLNDDQNSNTEWMKHAIRNSDIIFAVCNEYYVEAMKLNNKCFLIPHGVDYTLFETAPKVGFGSVLKLNRIKKPVLGFLSLMHDKVDFNLVNYVAVSRQDWSILLMGRDSFSNAENRASFKDVVQKKNVYYVGEIPREAIPYYLQHVDICLIPLKKGGSCRSEYGPLKLLEYLAAGKPVVAVDQGIGNKYSKFIKVAETKEEFVKAISETLKKEKHNGKSLSQARKKIARQNSWDNRVDQMMEIVEWHLNDQN